MVAVAAPPLALHIAAHVRRGDLAGRDPARLVSTEEVGAALAELARVVAELRDGDAAHGALRLSAAVHVMSEVNIGVALVAVHTRACDRAIRACHATRGRRQTFRWRCGRRACGGTM